MKKMILSLSVLIAFSINHAPLHANLIGQVGHFLSYLTQETHRQLWTDYKQYTPFKLSANNLKDAEQIGATVRKKNPDFLVGASTSEHQCSHKCTPEICSWSRFAKDMNLSQSSNPGYHFDKKNLWDNYEEFIDRAADFGMNALRVSIEWALVQPHEPRNKKDLLADENFDQKALEHYADMITYMISKGITPVICFHHYTDPCWFIDLKEQYKRTKNGIWMLGGFEHKANSTYFVAFCQKTYESIVTAINEKSDANTDFFATLTTMHLPLWATFNSPTGYAFKCYQKVSSSCPNKKIYAQGPVNNPDKVGLQWTMEVLGNMMDAHVQVYDALRHSPKQIKTWDDGVHIATHCPQIGLLHNIHQLRPYKKFYSPITCIMGEMLQHESFYQFFTNGHFRAYIPGAVNVDVYNARGPKSLDWIGLNNYSDGLMDGAKKVSYTKNETRKTDSDNYYINGQSLGRALLEVADRIAIPVGKHKGGKPLPIYVTENGIATDHPEKREFFYKEYLNALAQAQARLATKGVTIGGYLTWTLFDNYEWPRLDNKPESRRRYGVFTIDETGAITQKPGTEYYQQFARTVNPVSFGTN